MKRPRRLLVIALALTIIVGVGVIGVPRLLGYGSPTPPYAAPGSGASMSIRKDSRQPVVIGQPVRLGVAPKVLRVYLDFHCPDCADFVKQYGSAIDQAVQDDRAQLAVYPLAVIDDGSAAAANAFACAAEGGGAPEYLAGLSANPGLKWTDGQLIAVGDFAGLNFTPGFATCVHDTSHRAWVDSMKGVAAADGVSGTPAVFLGADRVDVATLTPERLRALLQG